MTDIAEEISATPDPEPSEPLYQCICCKEAVTPLEIAEGRAGWWGERTRRCVCRRCWRTAIASPPTGPEDLARALALVADMPDVPVADPRPRPEAVRRPYRAARPRHTYWRWSQW